MPNKFYQKSSTELRQKSSQPLAHMRRVAYVRHLLADKKGSPKYEEF